MNLLLVDAEPESLSPLLEGLGARIHCVASGEAALRELLRREFAAVVFDVDPPGEDAFETAAAIRTLEPLRRVPILFLSTEGERRTRCRDPHSEFIMKPTPPELLRARVAAHCNRETGSGS
jgi:DNA-binding response OmpR family regulator